MAFALKGGASKNSLLNLNKFDLPEDYLSTFSELNGGEGFIGDEYLILWKAEELEYFNNEYEEPLAKLINAIDILSQTR